MMISKYLYKLYGKINNIKIRDIVISIVNKIEGGEIYSSTLRDIFRDYHKIDIGMYTHGGCFVRYQVQPFTTIGRYCSIAPNIRIFNREHPIDFLSTSVIFAVSQFGFCEKDLMEYMPICIGNDVWIGHNSIILPPVKNIGDGAIIAAGSVVNKDIPPYAIVAGYPARIVRYRFDFGTIDKLVSSRWWEKSLDEIKPHIKEFQRPFHKDMSFLIYDKH